jgi:hypothetical protein
VEQQRMSADSVSQWAQACINADAIIGGGMNASHDLGQRISSEKLREAYNGYCGQHRLRPVPEEVFGKACAQMFGSRVRTPTANPAPNASVGKVRRPWGYEVPEGDTWQGKLDARLGIN